MSQYKSGKDGIEGLKAQLLEWMSPTALGEVLSYVAGVAVRRFVEAGGSEDDLSAAAERAEAAVISRGEAVSGADLILAATAAATAAAALWEEVLELMAKVRAERDAGGLIDTPAAGGVQ